MAKAKTSRKTPKRALRGSKTPQRPARSTSPRTVQHR